MKIRNIIILAFTMCLAVACGSDDSFRVMATVDGLGTQNVRAVYRSGGRVNVVPAVALDGKFQFSGNSAQPVLIDLYTGSRSLIGSLVVSNGETVEVSFKLNEPGYMTAKGDKISEQMARFKTANSEAINNGDDITVNNAVARYVADNLKNPAAAYIVMSMYNPSIDPSTADSLLTAIDPKARPAGDLVSSFRETLALGLDTLPTFSPVRLYTTGDSMTTIAAAGSRGVLLAFSGVADGEPHDSLVSRLNVLHDSLKTRVRVVELSTVADTAAWHGQIDNVKPRYTRCWMPGGVSSPALDRIAVRRLPWYVAADSTGSILYAGPQLNAAAEKL